MEHFALMAVHGVSNNKRRGFAAERANYARPENSLPTVGILALLQH
jgi:hypothetical protein